jgi:hypothetical protein
VQLHPNFQKLKATENPMVEEVSAKINYPLCVFFLKEFLPNHSKEGIDPKLLLLFN